MSAVIGRLPEGVTARELLNQLDRELRAEEAAAREREEERKREIGKQRAAEVEKLRKQQADQLEQLEWFFEQARERIDALIDTGEKLAAYGQPSGISSQFLAINLPNMTKPGQWASGFTSTEARLHQIAAERRKAKR